MIQWACLIDRHRLVRKTKGHLCPLCGHLYENRKGVSSFYRPDDNGNSENRTFPLLADLRKLMETQSSDKSADIFCRKYACSKHRYGADWKFFFSVPEAGTVLEFGAGFGEDTIEIAARTDTVISIVPSRLHAEILSKRLAGDGIENVEIAVMQEITRLPLPDRSVAAIVISDAAGSGFHVGRKAFSRIAKEWQRILAPGGSVVLGLANPVYRWLGLDFLLFKMIGEQPESIQRIVKSASASDRLDTPGLRQTVRSMIRLGFNPPFISAPIPGDRMPDILLPVEDSRVVLYFLDHLIRKNSPVVRAAISVSKLLVRLNLFHRLVPYYYLYFKRSPASTEEPPDP
jgi:SAM-dependent methyltransferase